MVYVAIALFVLVLIWLALQPKQGTRAANAPSSDRPPAQLPKPQELPDPPASKTPSVSKVSYEDPSVYSESPKVEPPETSDANHLLQRLLQQNKKIEAIKLVRSKTGWGLKQSKEYVEMFPDVAPLPDSSNSSQPAMEPFDINRYDINDRIKLLLQQNQKVTAIKLVRTATNWSLKESKEYIDRYPDVPDLPIKDL
ncbi:MAG: ribosomal protein L7/L12 [Leptolyngbyaceae cyanobacterium]